MTTSGRKGKGTSVFTGNKNLRIHTSAQSFSGRTVHQSVVQKPRDLRRNKAATKNSVNNTANDAGPSSNMGTESSASVQEDSAMDVEIDIESYSEGDEGRGWIDEEISERLQDGFYEFVQAERP